MWCLAQSRCSGVHPFPAMHIEDRWASGRIDDWSQARQLINGRVEPGTVIF